MHIKSASTDRSNTSHTDNSCIKQLLYLCRQLSLTDHTHFCTWSTEGRSVLHIKRSWPASGQHQQIGQCLLPLVAANFFVDDPAGTSSRRREECWRGLLLTVAVPAKQMCSPVGGRCDQIINDRTHHHKSPDSCQSNMYRCRMSNISNYLRTIISSHSYSCYHAKHHKASTGQ